MAEPTISAVFELVEDIPEIRAVAGDRIVIRPWASRVAVLQRDIQSKWAFDDRLRLLYTEPAVPHPLAIRRLRATLPEERIRGGHLTLVP